jgi:CheY-like chemotaxis protein
MSCVTQPGLAASDPMPTMIQRPRPGPTPDIVPLPTLEKAGLGSGLPEEAGPLLAEIRTIFQGVARAADEAQRLRLLRVLNPRVTALADAVALTGFGDLVRLAEALEVMLKELPEKPERINHSLLRTASQAIGVLGVLLDRAPELREACARPYHVLVVDDDPIARTAITVTLEKCKLTCAQAGDPAAALEYLRGQSCDLIFLDVKMPGMNGFDVCAQLRQLPAHQDTPVIYVTSLDDFVTRSRSAVNGGTDLMAKPFSGRELAVKALTYAFKSRYATDSARAGALDAGPVKLAEPASSGPEPLRQPLSPSSVAPGAKAPLPVTIARVDAVSSVPLDAAGPPVPPAATGSEAVGLLPDSAFQQTIQQTQELKVSIQSSQDSLASLAAGFDRKLAEAGRLQQQVAQLTGLNERLRLELDLAQTEEHKRRLEQQEGEMRLRADLQGLALEILDLESELPGTVPAPGALEPPLDSKAGLAGCLEETRQVLARVRAQLRLAGLQQRDLGEALVRERTQAWEDRTALQGEVARLQSELAQARAAHQEALAEITRARQAALQTVRQVSALVHGIEERCNEAGEPKAA